MFFKVKLSLKADFNSVLRNIVDGSVLFLDLGDLTEVLLSVDSC